MEGLEAIPKVTTKKHENTKQPGIDEAILSYLWTLKVKKEKSE